MKKVMVIMIAMVMAIMLTTSVFAYDLVKKCDDGDIVVYLEDYDTWMVFKDATVFDGGEIVCNISIVDDEKMEVVKQIYNYHMWSDWTWHETFDRVLTDVNMK